MKIKECCKIISQECIAKDIYSMWISTEAIAKEAKPGQFISVYTKDAGKLLPRPISLCEIDREKGALRIVYRIAGGGTGSFPDFAPGIRLIFSDRWATGFRWRRQKESA